MSSQAAEQGRIADVMPAELRHDLHALLGATPIYALLGISLDEIGPGHARVSLPTRFEHGTLASSVHAGIVSALADTAFEIASNSYGRLCVALETSCHFSRIAQVGDTLVAEAVEVSRSRRTASHRIEVRGADGVLHAWYMGLAFRTERWHLGADRWPAEWRDAH